MAGVGKGSSHLSPPDRASGPSTPAPIELPLGFFGTIMDDPHARDFPDAVAAAVRWTYVPIQGIGSYCAVNYQRTGIASAREDIPEFKIALSLLDDVTTIIQDGRQRYYRKIPFPRNSSVTSERIFYEAVRWVLSLDELEHDKVSFERACEILDLDAELVKNALLYGPIEHCTTTLIEGGRRSSSLPQLGHHTIGKRQRVAQ